MSERITKSRARGGEEKEREGRRIRTVSLLAVELSVVEDVEDEVEVRQVGVPGDEEIPNGERRRGALDLLKLL